MEVIRIFPILSLAVLISCGQRSKVVPTTTSQALKIDSIVKTSLEIVKVFAESYSPKGMKGNTIPMIEDATPDEIITAVNNLKNMQSHEKYLTLIFLKLYRSHLECCNQSYEVRGYMADDYSIDSARSPLLYEFNRLTKLFNPRHAEFIPSHLAIKQLQSNPQLLEYEPINIEFKKIQEIEKNINNNNSKITKP